MLRKPLVTLKVTQKARGESPENARVKRLVNQLFNGLTPPKPNKMGFAIPQVTLMNYILASL